MKTTKTFLDRLFDRLRAWPWLLASTLTVSVVGWIAPHQLGVLIWSLSKLCLGAYLGYWIDRSIFHYARPDFRPQSDWRPGAVCMLRRALLMSAAILALGLGV